MDIYLEEILRVLITIERILYFAWISYSGYLLIWRTIDLYLWEMILGDREQLYLND